MAMVPVELPDLIASRAHALQGGANPNADRAVELAARDRRYMYCIASFTTDEWGDW